MVYVSEYDRLPLDGKPGDVEQAFFKVSRTTPDLPRGGGGVSAPPPPPPLINWVIYFFHGDDLIPFYICQPKSKKTKNSKSGVVVFNFQVFFWADS